MSVIPDKQRFKVGSTGRTLDLEVRDTSGALPDLNSYASATVKWHAETALPSTAVAFTNVTLIASPVDSPGTPNARVQFSASELSSANVGRHYVFVEVETSAGVYVQPPEDRKGILIEVFE